MYVGSARMKGVLKPEAMKVSSASLVRFKAGSHQATHRNRLIRNVAIIVDEFDMRRTCISALIPSYDQQTAPIIAECQQNDPYALCTLQDTIFYVAARTARCNTYHDASCCWPGDLSPMTGVYDSQRSLSQRLDSNAAISRL